MQIPYTHISDYEDNITTRMFFALIPIERGYSHFRYSSDAASHNLLVQLKYNHRPDIGVKMGRYIASQLLEKDFFNGIDGIVAIPLHWIRLLERGYNQSAQIARGISEVTQIPVNSNVVRRVTNNKSQTGIRDTSERRKNVQDIFVAKETTLEHILLVDDVLTTGATITACATAILRKNPHVRFSVMTMAKA